MIAKWISGSLFFTVAGPSQSSERALTRRKSSLGQLFLSVLTALSLSTSTLLCLGKQEMVLLMPDVKQILENAVLICG